MQTVRFTKIIFDALNVSNVSNGKKKRKQFQDPYRSGEDTGLL